ncbi:MAG: AraC family transcriptional regulator [Bauldia sp.]
MIQSGGAPDFRGLEQFKLVASTGGINYCVADGKPYALEFANDFDVICLLLGDINSQAKFEDDREQPLTFLGETSAFHPRGGNVRVAASEVRHGFIAFGYSPEFQSAIDDFNVGKARILGSKNNIDKSAIRHLARYARTRLQGDESLEPVEVQYLATLVFLETVRHLGAIRVDTRTGLSDIEFKAICAFIDGELESEISCLRMARAVNLPLRVIFDGVKARTGFSPYRFVLEKRIERAKRLLETTDAPISEIAIACGFSSQQHLTSTLSRKLGRTPYRLRKNLR